MTTWPHRSAPTHFTRTSEMNGFCPSIYKIPILGLLLAGGLWLLLELAARTRFPSPVNWRGPCLCGSQPILSQPFRCQLQFIGWQPAAQPAKLPTPLIEAQLRRHAGSAIGLIWTVLRCKSGAAAQWLIAFPPSSCPPWPSRDACFSRRCRPSLIGTVVVVQITPAILRLLGAVLKRCLAPARWLQIGRHRFRRQETIVENLLSGVSLLHQSTVPWVGEHELPDPRRLTAIGEVEQIGWFHTRLRDLESPAPVIPNVCSRPQPVINRPHDSRRNLESKIRSLRFEDHQGRSNR